MGEITAGMCPWWGGSAPCPAEELVWAEAVSESSTAMGMCRASPSLFLMALEAGEAPLVFSSGSPEPPPMSLLREVPSGLHTALGTAGLVGWQIGEAALLLSSSMSACRKCLSFPISSLRAA